MSTKHDEQGSIREEMKENFLQISIPIPNFQDVVNNQNIIIGKITAYEYTNH